MTRRIRLKNEVLAELIRSGRLSQNAWALRLGLSRGHLSQLIRGDRPYPCAATRQKLLEGLGVPFDLLFSSEEPGPASPGRIGAIRAPTRGSHPRWPDRRPPGPGVGRGLPLELRYAFRVLLRMRGAGLAGLLTTAIGIGFCATILGVVYTVLWKPLPYPDSDQLVRLGGSFRPGRVGPVSPAVFLEMERELKTVESISGSMITSINLEGSGHPRSVRAAAVSDQYFNVLGIPVALGTARVTARDSESNPTVVLSYPFWTRQFGRDPSALNQTLRLDGRLFRIIGITGPHFRGPEAFGNDDVEMWIPLAAADIDLTDRANWYIQVLARLAPGTRTETTAQEFAAFFSRLTEENPELRMMRGELQPLKEATVGKAAQRLWPLVVAALLLFLVSVTNVTHLLAARGTERSPEIALRLALGSPRLRVFRQFLLEGVLLSLAGGLVAIPVAAAAIGALLRYDPGDLPRVMEVALGPPLLAGCLILALLSSIFFGLAPMLAGWSSLAGTPNDLRKAPRLAGRLRSILIVGQTAAALILLGGCGVLIRSWVNLNQVDPGFNPEGAFTVSIDLRRQYENRDQRAAFFAQLVRNLNQHAGIRFAGTSSGLPFSGMGSGGDILLENQPPGEEKGLSAAWQVVSPGLLEALATPLESGRFFDWSDQSSHPVVAVNGSFARQFWPGVSPLGKRLKVIRTGPDAPWLEVIGVLRDFSQSSLAEPTQPEIYVPLGQSPLVFPWAHLVVRSDLTAGDVSRIIQTSVRDLDPRQPIGEILPYPARIAKTLRGPRFYLLFLSSFSLIALSLAALGMFGALSLFVAQTRRETGVRMALGARSGQLVSRVVWQGIRKALLGTLIGMVGALAASSLLQGFVFGISAQDPWSLVAACLVLLATCLAATLPPALRAAHTDPSRTLREG